MKQWNEWIGVAAHSVFDSFLSCSIEPPAKYTAKWTNKMKTGNVNHSRQRLSAKKLTVNSRTETSIKHSKLYSQMIYNKSLSLFFSSVLYHEMQQSEKFGYIDGQGNCWRLIIKKNLIYTISTQRLHVRGFMKYSVM